MKRWLFFPALFACRDGTKDLTATLEAEEVILQDVDGDGYLSDEDCDDGNALIHPSAEELCDGVDNDCDGLVNEDNSIDATTYFLDFDSDGYGNPAITFPSCSQPTGHVLDNTDCNDSSDDQFPGNPEIVEDGVDQDCSGRDSLDVDDDGSGDHEDCDDNDAAVFPDAEEIADGLDNNCDGLIDDEDDFDTPMDHMSKDTREDMR